MSNTVKTIISELESAFIDHPSTRNCVRTCDGEIVRLDEDLLEASPVLRDHLLRGVPHKVLPVPKSSLAVLCDAWKTGTMPRDFASLLTILAVTVELQMRGTTLKCFRALRMLENSDERDYPAECTTETVIRCFEIFLSTPLRTMKIYKKQLARISKHCSDNRDVMLNVINLVKQKLEKFIDVNPEGIPIGFNCQILPVVIFKRNGKRHAAIIESDELRLVNVFGQRFDLTLLDDSFYLKYGEYVLYKKSGSVYYKDLQEGSLPIEKLKHCSQLLTRGNFVFAVYGGKDDKFGRSIAMWKDDNYFVNIYEGKYDIQAIDFECDSCRMVILSNRGGARGFALFRLEDNNLFIVCEISDVNCGNITTLLLSANDIHTVRDYKGEHWVRTFTSESGFKSSLDSERSSRFWSPRHVGDSHFDCWNGLRILGNFPCLRPTKTLLTPSELCAISELWMLL